MCTSTYVQSSVYLCTFFSHIEELHHNRQELERSRELLTTYELSIARKDQIITSLTKSLQKQVQYVHANLCVNVHVHVHVLLDQFVVTKCSHYSMNVHVHVYIHILMLLINL